MIQNRETAILCMAKYRLIRKNLENAMHGGGTLDEETGQADQWSEWLLHTRHADDLGYETVVKEVVGRFADRVLDDARLYPGMTLLDVGAGDGLLTFRAIERMGKNVSVVLTDISAPLLRHAEASAARRGVRDQCTFMRCSAEKLTDIADSTIDAVVARASIAYVPDKKAAFGEFHRVLRPGGRISIAEPIMQDEAFAARALRRRLDAPGTQLRDRFLVLLHRWKSAQYPDTEEEYLRWPLVNFSERDLVSLARGAGFSEVHMQLHIDVVPSLITSWEIFLGSSPHPLAPSLRTILAERFSAEERQLFESMVRPTVESGKNMTVERVAYLNSSK
jgi:SAM-dependent methyltransferase